MDIQIRKASICDLEQINTLENTLKHRILSCDILHSTLKDESYYYYVAIKEEKIIGYIVAQLMVDHFDLLAIAVLDEFRRQNIATLLLKNLFNICSELNISDIFLEVRCGNAPAIKFYEKSGFEKVSTRKNYYSDTGEDAYIYKTVV